MWKKLDFLEGIKYNHENFIISFGDVSLAQQ